MDPEWSHNKQNADVLHGDVLHTNVLHTDVLRVDFFELWACFEGNLKKISE